MKVSVAVTAKEGLVVGMRSMPGNPYDGHTLANAIEQVEILTATTPSIVLADRGCRGAKLEGDRTRLMDVSEILCARRVQERDPVKRSPYRMAN